MISVCVPYWNRQQQLTEMLVMYRRLYPHLDIEISVCDDGTPVPARVPQYVTLTRLPMKEYGLNPCVPINAAVEASKGEIIVVTNPEVQHDAPILDEMLGLMTGPLDYVIASCRHRGAGHRGSAAHGLWLAGPLANPADTGREPIPPGGGFHFLVMFRRSLWDRAGGFDPEYRAGVSCEDNDWLWRAYEAGAVFKTTQGVVWHRRDGPRVNWSGRPNKSLLRSKWPPGRREKVIAARTGQAYFSTNPGGVMLEDEDQVVIEPEPAPGPAAEQPSEPEPEPEPEPPKSPLAKARERARRLR